MRPQSWGYKKHDQNWKSAQTVYEKLADIKSMGGNLLLNVGPDGNGIVQQKAIDILMEVAQLIREKPIEKMIPQTKEVPGVR
jgi:alpha-L-fucosidase